MRGNEFLDKMELIDPAYVEAADARPRKKKAVWVKWGATAACLCIIAAAALALTADREPAMLPVPAPDGPTRWEPMPEVWPEHPILRPGDEGYIEPAPTPDSFNLPDIPVQTPGNEGSIEPAPEPVESINGAMIAGPNNVTEFPNVIPMISDYGEMSYPGDMAVTDGGVCFSQTLLSAMEHYGDTVKYRVYVELFHDGVQISSGGELAWQEMQRLGDLGYIVALEKIRKTEDKGEFTSVSESYHFTLHATYAQLKDFSASETLGYSLMLYGEYFGASPGGDAVIFNGFVQSGS